MLRRAKAAWFVFPVLLLAGCEKDEALVQLRPVGERLERTLTLQRVDHAPGNGARGPSYGTVPAEVLADAKRWYDGEQPAPRSEVHVFRGTFTGRLPDDLGGGFGSYLCCATELGSSSTYLERFRGASDVLTISSTQSAAVDRAIDSFASWLRRWLEGYAQGERVLAFVEGDLRRDLKALLLNLWLSVSDARASKDSEVVREKLIDFASHVAHFLLERDYLDAADVPSLAMYPKKEDALPLPREQWLRDLLARKGGVTDPRTAKRLRELFEPAAAASLKEHLAKSPGKGKGEGSAGNPFLDLIITATGASMESAGDAPVTLELALPGEPLTTNGAWDAATRRVTWSFPLPSKETADRRLAQFCRASWVAPDEGRQRALFGRVVLTGERLAHYCEWRSRLPGPRAKEWSAFLDGLRPGPGLDRRLRGFAFSGGQPDQSLSKVLEWLAE